MEFSFKISTEQLKSLERKTPDLLTRFVKRAGMAWERDAVTAISVGGRHQAEATGNLKQSIGTRVEGHGANARAVVYATAKYAQFVHDGTGIYGPRRRLIVPTRGKALKFTLASGRVVFCRSSKGMRPKPFFAGTVQGVIKRLPDIFRKSVGESLV